MYNNKNNNYRTLFVWKFTMFNMLKKYVCNNFYCNFKMHLLKIKKNTYKTN